MEPVLDVAKEFSYLLVGQTSQGRGSDEREEALIHLIAKKMLFLAALPV